MTLIAIFTFMALVLMVIGFFKPDPLVWMLNVIMWLVWSYFAYNEAVALNLTNSYIPTALAIIGAGFTFYSIYKTIAVILNALRNRPQPLSADQQYEEDKQFNARHIYSITRRRF